MSAPHVVACETPALIRSDAARKRWVREVAPGEKVIDQPDFPEAYKPEAHAGGKFLDFLRGVDDLDWTFLSPAAQFGPGERTGTFRLGQDTLLTHDEGSSISFEDYAIALVDELETPRHVRQRFTVGY